MKTLQIFDPAMCCSTGICGPSVDTKLVELAADVAFLISKGVKVERFNLGHQPNEFATNQLVMSEMGAEAEHLPIFVIDGEVKAKGRYPDRSELVSWFGLEGRAGSDELKITVKASSACCEGEGCC